MAVDNLAAANPNRRGRSPSPGNARTFRSARRRLALDEAASSDRSSDGSRTQSPCNGGGGGRPCVVDRPGEDGLDNDYNQRHFSALSQPPISLCFSNLARFLRPRTRPFLFGSNRSRMNRTSVRRRRLFATTKTQVDLDFAFILMISAIYSTPLSFLTSVIWTISDTITISMWLPPKRETCPELSPWSPSFLRW